MKIKNETDKPIKLFFTCGKEWDSREEVVQPGELSDVWLHMEEDDVIVVRRKNGKVKRG